MNIKSSTTSNLRTAWYPMIRGIVLSIIIVIVATGCEQKPQIEENLRAEQVPTSDQIFSFYDEILTFRVKGDASEGGVNLNMNSIYNKFGEIRDFKVYRFGSDLCLKPIKHWKVEEELIVNANLNDKLVVVPEINTLVEDNYKLICRLRLHVIPEIPRLQDEICQRILCEGPAFKGTELYEEFPRLEKFREELRLEELTVGGITPRGPVGPDGPMGPDGGTEFASRNVCERCLDYRDPGTIIPTEECFGKGPKCISRPEVSVINMIPQGLSGETGQDSEPFLTIDPDESQRMVGSAFTRNPGFGNQNVAPVFITEDGGQTWSLNNIVQSLDITSDITMGAASDTTLVAGILVRGAANRTESHQRTDDYLSNNQMNENFRQAGPDQPFTVVHETEDTVRVYIGSNDLGVTGSQTASIFYSNDGGQNYNALRLETRNPVNQDAPSVRPAVSNDGTVYAAFARYQAISGNITTWDLTVVRDDNWGEGTNPFQDLTDPSDGQAGRMVVTGRTVIWNNGSAIGQERIGSHMSLAVHPTNSDIVYVSWTDTVGTGMHNLHVYNSTDGGETWNGDLVNSIPNVTAHALAINSSGTVGLLIQQYLSDDDTQEWRTQVLQTTNAFSTIQRTTLAQVPGGTPTVAFWPYIGDYNQIIAHGDTFRGIFSANNEPDNDHFPSGVTYQREADFTTNQLTDGAGNNVNVSIDPFYFSITAKN